MKNYFLVLLAVIIAGCGAPKPVPFPKSDNHFLNQDNKTYQIVTIATDIKKIDNQAILWYNLQNSNSITIKGEQRRINSLKDQMIANLVTAQINLINDCYTSYCPTTINFN